MDLLTTKDLSLSTDEIRHLENKFYEDKFYFSYSSLNKLLWNPAQFYQEYVLKKKETKTDRHLVEGKVIHALLLSQDIFNQLFVIVPGKVPGDNTRKVVDRVFSQYKQDLQTSSQKENLQDYSSFILEILKEMNLHQKFVDDKKPDKDGIQRTGDQKRLDQILTEDAKDYFYYLKKKGNRDVIDNDTLDFCQRAVEKIRSFPRIMELLGIHIEEFRNIEVYNEKEMQCDLDNYPFGLKGIIDNLVIDHDQKLILVNDLKTSGKDLKGFEDSLEYYNYWMQAVIYLIMIGKTYSELIQQEYRVQFRFIVIDRMHNVYPFRVSAETMSKWKQRFIDEGLFKALYHYTNKQYTLPYEFAEDLVIL